MDKNLDNFWQWVNRRMDEMGISSYRQLSEMAGVSHGTINAQRNQLKPPTVETAEGLCRALDVDWVELWSHAGYAKKCDKDNLSDIDQKIIESLSGQDYDFKQTVHETITRWVFYENKRKRTR